MGSGSSYAQQLGGGKTVLVIHGGAGTIRKANMTPEVEREYREKLSEALRAGHAILARGGSSLDAVEATIHIMEDSPLFNAGKGAVFTHEGRNELDASIMDGRNRAAGAVAGVSVIRHPISAARAVMEKSEHVLLSGKGADLFATAQGLEVVDPSWFWTERRWKELQKKLMEEGAPGAKAEIEENQAGEPSSHKFGTVGAVALDRAGNLAAGTSTGGRTNKRWARVGDSPIIGAGTWADNKTCAVSGTGHGEFFIRWVVAYDVAALMSYAGLSVEEAAARVIATLKDVEGEAGLIALDAKGNFAMPFNTEGMYRGWIRADGEPHVQLYEEESAAPAKPR
ncbi:MAG TPA: isoaspartyl peptidase/L-asparaginase [Thermoanaerobaculia bacterium]|nr:isoaspartyl peptidase/L-asparaginase [Thermoanaerobaculia bacterium]